MTWKRLLKSFSAFSDWKSSVNRCIEALHRIRLWGSFIESFQWISSSSIVSGFICETTLIGIWLQKIGMINCNSKYLAENKLLFAVSVISENPIKSSLNKWLISSERSNSSIFCLIRRSLLLYITKCHDLTGDSGESGAAPELTPTCLCFLQIVQRMHKNAKNAKQKQHFGESLCYLCPESKWHGFLMIDSEI